ncbi:dehydrogenase [Sphingobium lactosutens]|nr:dehydrogenase [Sphingobium lactosutens]
MNVVVCTRPGQLDMIQRERPMRQPGEVLIRVRRVGMCGTDMHIYRGVQPFLEYPRVMGHEVSGEVAEVDEGAGLSPGDQVYVMPYMSCGTCIACAKGKTNCCTRIEVLGVHRDGALAEYITVPHRFVVKAEGIDLDAAAMIEFLAIGAHAVRRANITVGRKTLVVGAGPIGIAAAIFAKAAGGMVTAIDARQDRLDTCRDAVGVEHIVVAREEADAELSRLTDGDFYDVVIDATGSPAAIEAGFARVGHGGTYVLVSVVAADIRFSDPEFHKRETTLLASRNATAEDFETVVTAMRAGKVPLAALATHRATLTELAEALPRWMDPRERVIKALVEL